MERFKDKQMKNQAQRIDRQKDKLSQDEQTNL